ncbi:DUF4178 domain-containing protein [Nannocystis bainbridge]|uniref:DUF4178 domain-containing protein n=1 Tax=Nannocystis bainbridge TaxID=2995303 RepID=A0ABT5DXF9_9BACT|nr:DUF4178 domain-containing protein [Nannocystis bainbridge]MDC0717136.1 DUF4178 domain-containing protein [Nannocystis bainbridge]
MTEATPDVTPRRAEATPQRLFRDEARTEAVQCVACGGPLALRGFGAIQRVVCPACGSTLRPEDSGALALIDRAARAHQPSTLPLHARGRLDGATWEIVGICWRTVLSPPWPWQEFLLYNPYRGYRYLAWSERDGHWSLGQVIPGAPQIVGGKRHVIAYRGRRYRHFAGADAHVTYAEGEFPWQVQVGDAAHVDDFVAPPHGISIEEVVAADGVELTRTATRHLDADAVWRAFDRPGKPPKPKGVGMLAPNRWREQARSLWLSCLVFALAWYAAVQLVAGRASEREVFLATDLGFDAVLSQEITIGEPGGHTTVEVSFSAYPLDNSWAFAEVVLIPLESEEAIGLGLEVSSYSGFEDGESWTESERQADQVLGRVPGGRYLLQVTPERDTSALTGSDPLGIHLGGPFGVRSPDTWALRVREDVFLTRYAVLPLPIILGFPLLAWLLGRRRERKRWANSDYPL